MIESEQDRSKLNEAVLIGRLKSRRGAEVFRATRERLEQRGITILEAHTVETKKQLHKRLRRAIASGCALTIVCGGDGTLSKAVGEFARSKAILGVIPAGTGNSFALGLGIESLDTAIETIVTGRVAKVDLGRINGHYFADIAMIGLGAIIAENTSHALKHIIGPLAYGVSAIVPTLSCPPFDMYVKADGKVRRLRTHQAIVAAGRFFGHVPITPTARPADGMLHFFATRDPGRFDIIKTYVALLAGKQTDLANAQYFSAKKIVVKAKPKQRITLDGSSFGKTPARLSIERDALRVLVPATFPQRT